jgi:hypothetical protein
LVLVSDGQALPHAARRLNDGAPADYVSDGVPWRLKVRDAVHNERAPPFS